MANGDHQEVIAQIGAVAKDVGEVKIQVAAVNGKIDALTTRHGDSWAHLIELIAHSERSAQQAVTSLNDRVTSAVNRADERHADLGREMNDMAKRLDLRIDHVEQEEIKPLKTEAEINAAWRNRVIGWGLGAGFVFGIVGGLIVRLIP